MEGWYVLRCLINATFHRISIDSATVSRRINAAAKRAGPVEAVWRTLFGDHARRRRPGPDVRRPRHPGDHDGRRLDVDERRGAVCVGGAAERVG